jgi:hypothetical protein
MRGRRGTLVAGTPWANGLARRQRQRLFPFRERAERRERGFKRAIIALTVLTASALVAGTKAGRFAVLSAVTRARIAADQLVGTPPTREEIEPLVRACRARSVDSTRATLERFYATAAPGVRRLFRSVRMDPDHALVVSGMATEAFVLSPGVFAADGNGRSYRLLPNRRSVWIRDLILKNGPFGLFLVPDTPEARAAASAVGGVIDEPSAQTTNSWGLRGPEPDTAAAVRVLVLGDSFMQGMFAGDDDTPPLCLERELRALWGVPVSVLNTGHLGYAPAQYFATLKEYGPRFRPHFVVLSVCPNDLGHGDFESGYGDEWAEARYWVGEILQWCRSNEARSLTVAVPWAPAVNNSRTLGLYRRPTFEVLDESSPPFCDPIEAFVDEHLRLVRAGASPAGMGPLYNARVGDGHFSAAGARVWARAVARRIDLLMFPRPGDRSPGPAGASGRLTRREAEGRGQAAENGRSGQTARDKAQGADSKGQTAGGSTRSVGVLRGAAPGGR